MIETREQAIEIIKNYRPLGSMKSLQELTEETAKHFNYSTIPSSWHGLADFSLPYLGNLCIREESQPPALKKRGDVT